MGLRHFLSMARKWERIGTTAQRSIQAGRKAGNNGHHSPGLARYGLALVRLFGNLTLALDSALTQTPPPLFV